MRTIRTVLATAAGMIAVCLATLTPSAARAQCACASYGVSLDASVQCPITVCYTTTPSGPVICQTFTPGTTGSIPCFPNQTVSVIGCNGRAVAIPVIGCATVQIARGCCVTACMTQVGKCFNVSVTNAPCPQPDC